MKNRSLFITAIVAMLLIVLAVFNLNTDQAKQKETTKVAYKVVLDGKTWFYANDQAKLEGLLQNYKNHFAAIIDKKAKIISIGFKQNLKISKVDNYDGDLCSLQEAKEKIYEKTRAASQITVKDGDNIWSIAQAQQVSVDELQKLNPQLGEEMRIYPGDKLTIKAEKPVLDVVIVYENTVTEELAYKTTLVNDSNLYESQREIITAGMNGKQEVEYEIVLENNIEVERKTLNTRLITPPVDSKLRVGTKKAVSRSGSSFGVVNGSRISSVFGSRIHPITGKEIFHKGIDIAASQGNPVYAYANGIISYAGWKSGYGNFIAIDHGNGMVTRYAHLSAIYVSVGQRVTVRQKIGAVGSTGVSTGPHLHFEVLISGEYRNPQNYL